MVRGPLVPSPGNIASSRPGSCICVGAGARPCEGRCTGMCVRCMGVSVQMDSMCVCAGAWVYECRCTGVCAGAHACVGAQVCAGAQVCVQVHGCMYECRCTVCRHCEWARGHKWVLEPGGRPSALPSSPGSVLDPQTPSLHSHCVGDAGVRPLGPTRALPSGGWCSGPQECPTFPGSVPRRPGQPPVLSSGPPGLCFPCRNTSLHLLGGSV